MHEECRSYAPGVFVIGGRNSPAPGLFITINLPSGLSIENFLLNRLSVAGPIITVLSNTTLGTSISEDILSVTHPPLSCV
jgi:hypothetical protein